MKKVLVIAVFALFSQGVFADYIKESQAKVEYSKAKKEFTSLINDKKLARYLPYKKTLEADQDLHNAGKMLDDSDYDEASWYAVRSYAASLTAREQAEAWKAEVEILRYELDFYSSKVKSDKTWAIVALQSADLKRLGKRGRNFKGKLDAGEMLGFSGWRKAPRNADSVGELSSLGQERLDSIAKVLSSQKKARVKIEAWASRERRRKKDISEAYISKIKDYLMSKGVSDSQISETPKGKKRRKDIIQITVSNVTVK